MLAGRLSRAAVFAGATLAGCAKTAPAPQPPPPLDEQQVQLQRDPDPSPPPDAAIADAPSGTAMIKGIVLRPDGSPMNHVSVALWGAGTATETQTDLAGKFEFRGLPAGKYKVAVELESNHPRHSPPPGPIKDVTLADGAIEQLQMKIAPYVAPRDTGPCCKPYGAPPARRRVV